MRPNPGADRAAKKILAEKAAIEHSLKYIPVLTDSSGCSIDAGFQNLDDMRNHLDKIEVGLYELWQARGYSWTQIGENRQVTKQSAFKRYKRLLKK